jgi:hypothetical protein
MMQPIGSDRNPMLVRAEDVQQTFPARALEPDERALVAEWLAAASDVMSAFVSERRTDDPTISRRIAISEAANGAFTYLIHSPLRGNFWIVLDARYKPQFHRFDTLWEALNFVRPVLGPPADLGIDKPGYKDQGREPKPTPADQTTTEYWEDRRRAGSAFPPSPFC